MAASQTSRADVIPDFNHLQRGTTYRATTRNHSTVGEYLGIETPHGDWAILLRHGAGTESIMLCDVTSIQPASA